MSYTDEFLEEESGKNVSRETYEMHGHPDVPLDEWIGVIRIGYMHLMTEPMTWDRSNVAKKNDGSQIVLIKCKCGWIGSLVDHDVDDEGQVSPSVICSNEDCDFHEYVILDGWGEEEGVDE